MTLTTHAIVGAAAASFMPEHPVLGFCAGFTSHYVIDAIPHWDYPIYSDSVDPQRGGRLRFNRTLVRDILTIGFDGILGIALSFFFFGASVPFAAVIAGAFGGMLPDPLQFAYVQWKHQPLISMQKLHDWIHSDRELRKEGRFMLGAISQLAVIAIVVFVARL